MKEFNSFVTTLVKLVTANPHAKSKGDPFKKWCKDNFQLNSRIGYITSQQQTTNRVSEQFRYFEPIVVFVCSSDVKRESLRQYIFERVYSKLENVAIIGVTSSGEGDEKQFHFTYENLYLFKDNEFSEWISEHFEKVEDGKALYKEILNTVGGSRFSGDISPIIYYGAPGTGKTRYVQQEIYDKFPESNRDFTTFHQSYSYEDFVEGLKPILDDDSNEVKYHIEPGIFYNACEKAAILAGYDSLEECIGDTIKGREEKYYAAKMANKTMLLCIDEINRGNVASIFGDLISLIEPSKRLGAKFEMTVRLPYSKEHFGVPANLFIVGTMNTADRSIQLLDSALRRRFIFKEIGPNYTVFKENDEVQETAKTILENINSKIRCLLNKDNQIGHSYLMHVEKYRDIYDAIVNKIIPLLEEYFYNDVDKVRFVLNETNEKTYSFYKEDEMAINAFKSSLFEDVDEEKKFYRLEIKDNMSEEECKEFLSHIGLATNNDNVSE